MTTEAIRQDRAALEAELAAAGASIRGNAVKCPFHEDRHASAAIWRDEDGVWRVKCHACGVGGDVYDIRALARGRPVGEILREQSDRRPASPPAPKVYRGIEALRSAVAKSGAIGAEHRYVVNGVLRMLVFRLATPGGKAFRQCSPCPGGFWMRAPEKPWPLYMHDIWLDMDMVVVVEGEKCVDSLWNLRIPATTSPSGAGKAAHADWTALAGRRVVLWPDNDEAGRTHMVTVAGILKGLTPPALVTEIEPMDLDLVEKEDAADFVLQCRAAGLDARREVLAALDKAKPPDRPSASVRRRLEDMAAGKRVVVPFMGRRLTEESSALLPATVTVLCGSPGAAKSFWLLHHVLAWLSAGIKVACFMLEEDDVYHMYRGLALLEGNPDLFDPAWVAANAEAAAAAYGRHADVLDRLGAAMTAAPDTQPTLRDVARWITEKAAAGCRVVCVDPVTAAGASEKPWVVDSEFISAVKTAARKYDTSVLLVTHPKKGNRGAVGLDDLAGGAVYARLSQTILWLERHARPKEVTVRGDCGRFVKEVNISLHVCKARNGRGHGVTLGYVFDSQLQFAEQGVLVSTE